MVAANRFGYIILYKKVNKNVTAMTEKVKRK